MEEKFDKKEVILGGNFFNQRYNKLPEWLRWILFLPISFFFSIILWFFIASAAEMVGAYKFVLDILHPVIVQILFLILVSVTIPKGKLKAVKILIVLRSSFLIFFIASPILLFLGIEQIFDLIFFKEFAGEILTLFVSLLLFKELKKYKLEFQTRRIKKVY